MPVVAHSLNRLPPATTHANKRKKKKKRTFGLHLGKKRGRMITDIFGPMHKFGKSGWAISQTEDRGEECGFSVCGKSGGTT